ncbi:MAG: hypothetical protein H5T86_03380 [Armatimonadetes bacterium]|nr:hypothetical protein [Armatimonadota bacterium]
MVFVSRDCVALRAELFVGGVSGKKIDIGQVGRIALPEVSHNAGELRKN